MFLEGWDLWVPEGQDDGVELFWEGEAGETVAREEDDEDTEDDGEQAEDDGEQAEDENDDAEEDGDLEDAVEILQSLAWISGEIVLTTRAGELEDQLTFDGERFFRLKTERAKPR